jgi:hypothetical protein
MTHLDFVRFNELRWEVTARFVDIDAIADRHFLFRIVVFGCYYIRYIVLWKKRLIGDYQQVHQLPTNKGNNKITELRRILQRVSQNS